MILMTTNKNLVLLVSLFLFLSLHILFVPTDSHDDRQKPSSSYLSLSFSFVAYLIHLNFVFL